MSKKTIQGEGWKLISADDENKAPETIIISKAPEQQNLKIFLEKRKKGKIVTIIKGLILTEKDLKELTKSLKVACGTGGSIENNLIELQGDCQDKVKTWLKSNNWRVR